MILYNLINPLIIIVLGTVGLFTGAKLRPKVQDRMFQGVGLVVTFLGLSMALEIDSTVIMVLSMVIGGAIGEMLDIDRALNNWGKRVSERHALKDGNQFMDAVISTTLIFCVGTMSILGPLQLGISGDASTLITKSILDGISSVAFASTLGIGVIFSAIPVFIYQTAIYLLASYVAPLLTDPIIADLTGVGGVIIMGMGMGLLKMIDIPVANFLPAIIMPIIFHLVLNFLPSIPI